jgi:hypothetical protein
MSFLVRPIDRSGARLERLLESEQRNCALLESTGIAQASGSADDLALVSGERDGTAIWKYDGVVSLEHGQRVDDGRAIVRLEQIFWLARCCRRGAGRRRLHPHLRRPINTTPRCEAGLSIVIPRCTCKRPHDLAGSS